MKSITNLIQLRSNSKPIRQQYMSRLSHYFKLIHANPGPIIDQSSTEKPMDSQLANPCQSMPIRIGQSLGLKLNKSWGWNHRKSKKGTGTKIELEQKKYWGWNKRNPSFESKEMLGVQPETHLAWNASSFPKSANTAESDCHREPNILILGYCRWLAEVYNYYKMIRVQNKESKINIQFYQFEYEKGKGTHIGLVRET